MNTLLKKLCNDESVNIDPGNQRLSSYTLRVTVGTRLARLGDYSYASNVLGNSLETYMKHYVKPFMKGNGELMDAYLNLDE